VSRVCFTLRHIFQPYLDFDVRINCDVNLSRLKRKLAALDALFARISSIELFTAIPPLDKSPLAIPEPRVLNLRTKYIISTFLRNAPCMPGLHTATFSRIIMDQEHLELLFHSKSLHTLIFDHCSLRGMAPHTPSSIRHLEMRLVEDMEPFLGHCSANLETLHFICRHAWQAPGLQRFPKLRKLVFARSTSQLDTLTSLAPQLEYLEFLESDPVYGLPAIPASVNYFTTSQRMIRRGDFGTHPFLHIHHLHIKHASHGSITPIIQHVFPNLTSLELDITGSFRNFTLLLARALPNVTRLKLNIWDIYPRYDYYDTSQYIGETLGGRLSSLYVNVSSMICGKDCTRPYEDWILRTVFPPTVGLGGPHLQEVEVVFSRGSVSIPSVWWHWKRVEKEWFFKQY